MIAQRKKSAGIALLFGVLTLLAFLLIMPQQVFADDSNASLRLQAASTDAEPPVIEELSLDKTEVTVGDVVTFTLRASDESGIQVSSVYPYASAIMPELTPEFENWAALRYYTTPAEFESRFIRDFPSFVVDLLSDAGLAKPILLSEAQGAIPDKGPVRAAYSVPFSLPNDIPPEKLEKLGHIVLDVRRRVPRGSAKFASLAQKGFMQNAEDVNQVLQDALSSERTFNRFLNGPSAKLGIVGITTFVSFALSFVTTGTSDFASSVMLDAAVGYLADRAGAFATPFIQTKNQFEKRIERLM